MNLFRRIITSKYIKIIGDAIEGFGRDRVGKLSSSLAYTTIFSLAPMLVLIIIIAGTFYEKSAVEGKVFEDLKDFIGSDMASFIQNLILKISGQKSTTKLATIISSVILIVVATGLFVEIQDSMNLIWGVRPKKNKGLLKMIFSRLISFLSIILFGIFLVLILFLGTIFNFLSSKLVEFFPEFPLDIVTWVNTGFLFVSMSIFFALIYKLLPDVYIKWRDVKWPSIITSILFLIGKWIISLYISKNNTVSLYGAAGSVVILMLWIYFSAMIFYFGAELVRAVSEFRGRKIRPNQYSELDEKRLLQELKVEHYALIEKINDLQKEYAENEEDES